MICRAISAGALAVLLTGPVAAQPAGDFYADKQITLIVGADVGGGYDAQGRLMARFLGQFIAGHPTIVVQNMPAGGSIAAANHLYNIAARDGTVIGLMQRNVLTAKWTSPSVVKFEIDKFNWIGSLASETGVLAAWHDAPVTTAGDLLTKELVVGGTIGTDTEISGRLLNALAGTRLKIVSGYKGNADVLLAMERGEVQGIADESWSNLKTTKPDYLRNHLVTLLLQNALQKSPELPDVPLALDFARSAEDRKVMELYFGQKIVARPVMAPPGIPADHLALLRKAFMAMAEDAEFRDAAIKAKLELNPSSYEAVDRFVGLLATTPPAIAQRFQDVTGAH